MDNHSLYIDSWPKVSVSRAATYELFSSLLAHELTLEQITLYQQGAGQTLMDSLSAMGLEATVQPFNAAIAALNQFDDPQLELAADFTQLFLLDGKHSALPYASHYLEDSAQLLGAVETKMRLFLAESGLTVHEAFKEPADHIAIYFALLSRWIRQEQSAAAMALPQVATDQNSFLKEGLLLWLPEFVHRCQRIPTISAFYPALTQMLLAFIEEDSAYLSMLEHVDK